MRRIALSHSNRLLKSQCTVMWWVRQSFHRPGRRRGNIGWTVGNKKINCRAINSYGLPTINMLVYGHRCDCGRDIEVRLHWLKIQDVIQDVVARARGKVGRLTR